MRVLRRLSEGLTTLMLKTIGIFLLASPFLLGYGLYVWLSPSTFWQNLVFLFTAIILCGIEGIFAWWVGLATLDS